MEMERIIKHKTTYAVKISFENIDDCYIYNPTDFKEKCNYFFDDKKEDAFIFLEMHLSSYFGRNEKVKGSKFDKTVGSRIYRNFTLVDDKYNDNSNQLTINQIAEAVHNLAKEKGWHDDFESNDHFIERMCNNAHDEVSELHQAWRDNKLYLPCDKASKMKELNLKPLTCLEEDMADIIIRALDSCMKLKLDPQDIIARKHIFNTTRPHQHGGKRS